VKSLVNVFLVKNRFELYTEENLQWRELNTEIMGLELQKSKVRFVVLMVVKMSVLFFWLVMLCGLVCTYTFGEACSSDGQAVAGPPR
jgi:hypothetical protein